MVLRYKYCCNNIFFLYTEKNIYIFAIRIKRIEVISDFSKNLYTGSFLWSGKNRKTTDYSGHMEYVDLISDEVKRSIETMHVMNGVIT